MIIGKKLKTALAQGFVENQRHILLTTGIVVKTLREKNKLSQLQLAELTGLTQSTISSIEKNRISVGVDRAKVLALALKVHPAVIAFPDWDAQKIAA